MKMTFNDYIQNPMGIHNAVFSQREMFRTLYGDKLNKLMVREVGKVKYFLYKDTDRRYLIHLKIPSEVVKNFYYDTVIEYYTDDSTVEKLPHLNDYNVRFYSNDPSFVFTYAYSFNKNKLFIEDLIPKMSKQAITDKAVERNPKNLIGYVKSIYFAYLIIKMNGLSRKMNFTMYGNKYKVKDFLKTIMQADLKVEQRQELGKTAAKEKKVAAKTITQNPKPIDNANRTKIVPGSSRPNVSKTSIQSNRSKTTRTVKRK